MFRPNADNAKWYKFLEQLRSIREILPNEGTILTPSRTDLPPLQAVEQELEYLRVTLQYFSLDIEATRRELKEAQDILKKWEE